MIDETVLIPPKEQSESEDVFDNENCHHLQPTVAS